MNWNNIKVRSTDKEYSKYIRKKSGGKCERCGKVCEIDGERLYQLDCSHYYGRRNESVRFDDDNCHALCNPCHKRMGGHTREENGEYDIWLKEKLGETRYKMLKIRANATGKRDDKMQMLIIKQLMKDL